MSAEMSQVEQLRRILDVARRMAATTDLDDLLRTIVEAACGVLGCERATIFLYDPASRELYSRVATGAAAIRISVERGIAGAAARGHACVIVPDAYADPRFNPDVDRQTGFRTRNLLALPLENLAGELMGVLQLLNKDGAFGPADEDLARVLAAQAGVALHRWRLLEEYATKQRMARDLEIARSIQQDLFPKHDPAVPGYEVAGWNRPADETGGDCYDFLDLEDGRLAVLLADATGHGVGAALVIAQCRALVRAMLSVTQDLAVVARRVNRLLLQDLSAQRFVTAFLGILDTAAHRVDYFAAGQGPLVFVSAERTEERLATGLPLAVDEREPHQVASFAFVPGDTLVLLTDGFYETLSPAGELYGAARVAHFIASHGHLPLRKVIAGLAAELAAFSQGRPQADDLTAVLIRRSAR